VAVMAGHFPCCFLLPPRAGSRKTPGGDGVACRGVPLPGQDR
jgi:hypothetical protein